MTTDAKPYMEFMADRLLTLILVIAGAVSLTGCTDDFYPGDTPVGGEPAELTVGVELADADLYTRSTDLEKRVTSLWIGVFDANTGARKGYTLLQNLNDNQAEHVMRSVTIKTTTGLSRIVGVANFEHRFAVTPDNPDPVPISEALENVRSLSDFDNLAVTFTSRGDVSVDEPLNALLMMGEYAPDKENTHTGRPARYDDVNITDTKFNAPGAIHLRRLISHIRFNIKPNDKNIENFTVVDWQAHNVPNSSWLRERLDDGGKYPLNSGELIEVGGKRVDNSDRNIHFIAGTDRRSFEFWQIENRHVGLETDALKEKGFNYREEEFKNADGTNTGKYKSLVSSPADESYSNNASYVTFRVRMNLKVDENGNPLPAGTTRMAEAVYTVHLGYCEDTLGDKARDFRCRRNGKYIYMVTINNVNSMIVEARNIGETTPSVEGDVTDTSEKAVMMDAHYNVMNVYFNKLELENFSFRIQAFDENHNEVVFTNRDVTYPGPGDERYRFFKWVEFRKTTGEKVIADYWPKEKDGIDGKRTYLINELSNAGEGWYTMFIDEYVYEDYDEQGNISNGTQNNWHWYAGAPDRKVWLNMSVNKSDDGETMYYSSKYSVSQRSIQTYYSSDSEMAFGVEHVNETLGVNLKCEYNRNTYSSGNQIGYNQKNAGRFILSQYLLGVSAAATNPGNWKNNDIAWNKYVDFHNFQHINAIDSRQNYSAPATDHTLPSIIKENVRDYLAGGDDQYDVDPTTSNNRVEVLSACMNRNRDLDGDGKIDASELRWFVPNQNQYIQIILGRQSLPSPIMDYEGNPKLTDADNSKNSRFLIGTADGRQIWAMEGLSTSEFYRKLGVPWNIRCVRYLGSSLGGFSQTSRVSPPYTLDVRTENGKKAYYIKMDRLHPNGIRSEEFFGNMPPHHISDQRYNRCSYEFEVAGDDAIVSPKDNGGDRFVFSGNLSDNWAEYIQKYNPCAKLNKDGKTGWRIPNQKELSIISTFPDDFAMKPKINGGSNAYTLYCGTFTYYDKQGRGKPNGVTDWSNQRLLKILCDNGNMTQAENVGNMDNVGIRCVRDVVDNGTRARAKTAGKKKVVRRKRIVRKVARHTR